MYADTITQSMQQTIDETNRRRMKQLKYNEEHGITPTQITKERKSVLMANTYTAPDSTAQTYSGPAEGAFAADPIVKKMTPKQLEKCIAETTRLMKEAAKNLDFLQAAQYRDEIAKLMAMRN